MATKDFKMMEIGTTMGVSFKRRGKVGEVAVRKTVTETDDVAYGVGSIIVA